MGEKKPIPFPKSTRFSAQLPRGHGLGPKKRPIKATKAKATKAKEAKPGTATREAARPSLAELQEKAQRLVNGHAAELKRVKCWKCGAKAGEWCRKMNGHEKPLCKQRGKPEPAEAPSLIEWFEREEGKRKAKP
jgi:hypothetical protein